MNHIMCELQFISLKHLSTVGYLYKIKHNLILTRKKDKLRTSKRKRTHKNFGLDFQTNNLEGDLIGIFETLSSSSFDFLRETIDDEMESLMSNKTLKLLDLSLGCKIICCK